MKNKHTPIRRGQFDVQGFLAFVSANGGEIAKPTNPYEVCRYRAYWRGTNKASVHVVYAKENGLLTFTGGSKEHYRAFLNGTPICEPPGTGDPVVMPIVEPASSKGGRIRNRLRARDGDGCWFCGLPLGDDCTIEHLVPKAQGGRNALANYALAHQKCNAAAADLPLVEKIAMRERLRSGVEA